MKRFIPFILSLFASAFCFAQIGGDHVYEFLNTSNSARITALGGNLITVMDADPSLSFFNPASLNPSNHKALGFQYKFHLADIQEGYAVYAHHLDGPGISLAGGVKFINYGDFEATDVFGNINGSFNASEVAVQLSAAKRLYEKLSVGANVKLISSQLEAYSSFGMALDLSAMYIDTASNWTAVIIAKNSGLQLSTYEDQREDLPFEMQLGISKRLKYLPFRWSIIYHNLNRWNLLYDDPNSEESSPLLGNVETEDGPLELWFKNFSRHFIINGEFLFGKREMFNVRLGYNHLLRSDLSIENLRSLAGFSFGLGLRLKQFQLEYGHAVYHLAGGVNHLSISTNLNRFLKNH